VSTRSGTLSAAAVRSGCSGSVPLPGRLEPWQLEVCARPGLLAGWIEQLGSPLNVIDPGPLARNAGELQDAALAAGAALKLYFARKANKALALVDEAKRHGLGIDVASERELAQVLDRGVCPDDVVVTAAVKPRALLQLCAASGVTVVIDNEDELALLARVAAGAPRPLPIAFRLAPAIAPQTRFGLTPTAILELVERFWPEGANAQLLITGVHFHLDGYSAADRIAALGEAVELADALRARGHAIGFVDIGGGVPMSYLDDAAAWGHFWTEHRAALAGRREPLTFDGHRIGHTYPYFQEPTRGAWLEVVLRGQLRTRAGRQTAAAALRSRNLQLRLEPGRALLDGCGLTAARVEFRKTRPDGTRLFGLAMNRTQCRSTSDDFLVDPLLVRSAGAEALPAEGYLVGAYCIERELLTWRRLSFPRGVEVGDIIVFPNTAGYLMHILESASHQMPLARTLIAESLEAPLLDPLESETAPQPALLDSA
jgi:diaminopimelate decarboxylase